MPLDLYLCLLAVVLRRYKIRGWISKLAAGDAEINVEHGPYCQCDGCKDEPNEMMRWCLIDYATKPEHLCPRSTSDLGRSTSETSRDLSTASPSPSPSTPNPTQT